MTARRSVAATALPQTGAARPLSAHALAGAGVCAALLAAAFAVDPSVLAGFDAPKRLLVLAALVCSGLAGLASWRARPRWHWHGHAADWALLGVLLALGGGLLASAHAASLGLLRWDSLRMLLLMLLLLPLAAGPLLATVPWRGRIIGCVIAVCAVTALLSLLQSAGLQPIQMLAQSGRFPTGALLGNEGFVALACALLGAAALAAVLHPQLRRWRWPGLLLWLLAVVTIAINRQLTSAVALAAGNALVLAWYGRQRWVLPLGALLTGLALLCAVFAPLRAWTWSQTGIGLERYQELSTFRVGAWAATLGLIAEHPLLGHGPGRFVEVAENARLQAELQLRERLTPPINASAFDRAHQEYLQLAAELGLPTLLGVLVALCGLLAGLQRRAYADRSQAEPLLLLAVLVAGSVAALAWFPLQIPLTALILLLAAGRAWRVLAGEPGEAASSVRPQPLLRGLALLLAGALGVAVLWVEAQRYGAEARLAVASAALDRVLSGSESGATAVASAQLALAQAQTAATALPADSRPPLLAGTALMLLRRGPEARTVLQEALRTQPRPELMLNLGRALALLGDEAAARQAFLRAGWAAPNALFTLPQAMRADIQNQIAGLEQQLRAGQLQAVPGLDTRAN